MTTQQKLFLFLFSLIFAFASVVTLPVSAVSLEDLKAQSQKVAGLNRKIRDYEKQLKDLGSRANSLEAFIGKIQLEQASLQAQIDLKEAEHDQIVLEIESIEARIQQNSEMTSYVIAQYYYNSDVTTVERLASADSFASYVDNEMRLSNLADTLLEIIEENKHLKEQAVQRKVEAERILKELDSRRADLEVKKAEQARLLAEIQNDVSRFNRIKGEIQAERDAAREAQYALHEQYLRDHPESRLPVPGDPNKGGYPYADVCPAQLDWHADPWGMYICECVSYVAWRVDEAYGNMPYWGGRGNANRWVGNAISAGIPNGSTPKIGAVGVSQAGPYGHVVWVEDVVGDRVLISQYNWVRGDYSEMWFNAGYFHYIYFGEW